VSKKTFIVVGAFAMLSLAAPAQAGVVPGHNDVLSGNTVSVPITAPINVCGNSVAALGQAVSGCRGGSSVR
jgi:hypothetical protein